MERDFKGVWIPKDIWLNKELSILEKCLITEIDSLDNSDKGCFASNKYLSEFIGVSEGRCANIISDLKKREFIVQCFFDGRNRGLRLHENVKPTFKRESRLHENVKADFTKTLEHTSRKREHSNTVNNTGINKGEEEKEKPTATADNDDVPFFVKEQREKITPPRGAGEISRESLKADFSENDYCRMQAGREGIQKNDYENLVNEFILEKFGLEENTKWKDIKDARSHFVRWIPYFKSKTQKQNEGSAKNTGYSNSLRNIDNKNPRAAF